METDEGITGWGECYTQSDRDTQIVAHIDQLKEYIIGRNPMNIKHFLQISFDDFITKGNKKLSDEDEYKGLELDDLNRKCVLIYNNNCIYSITFVIL